MNKANTTISGIAAATLAVTLLSFAGATVAQEQDEPLYVSVECMKSANADYMRVETEIWQAMHQELVDQGKRNSWALYGVLYGDRTKCDFYTVTTLRGSEQLNGDPSFEEAFEAVHPAGNFKQAMARTLASRRNSAAELWLAIDGTQINEHRFAVVNKMYAADRDAYERMEKMNIKAAHQALLDGGHRSGWGMYELLTPLGSSIPYNYSTVDFMNHLDPVPMAEAVLSANPNRDIEELAELLELRDQVSSETWVLIAATRSASAGQ